MLKNVQKIGDDFDIQLNPKKTVWIYFSKNYVADVKICLNEKTIKWVTSVKHLGNYVTSDLSANTDCSNKCSAFIGSFNKLIGTNVLMKLFHSFCCSFYGSQLWNVLSPGFKKCCTQCNKAVRRLRRIPYKTHTLFLGILSNQLSLSVQLQIKFVM